MTSYKRNIAASYAGQIYVALIGIVLVPIYVRLMGAEAYGLIGFYTVLQAWFVLFDLGFTATISREAARFRGHAIDGSDLRSLLRTLEVVFFVTALTGAAIVAGCSGLIAHEWLNVQHIPKEQVGHALQLVAAIIALRWVSDLYRGVITGMEQIVWLNVQNIAIATLRYVGVIPFLMYIGTRPTDFFGFQAVVAVIELVTLISQTYHQLPKASQIRPAMGFARLRRVLRFSVTVAVTGAVWVVSTQTDKLVLSKLLPLSEYAYFTLAVLVASGVTILSVPISGPLLPRLVALNAEGKEEEFIRVYRNSTQLVSVVALPAAAVLAVFSKQVLWIWTGDLHIADSAASILTLYAIGNGVLAVSAFPYYLQFAKGSMRLHLIGSGLFIVVLIPILVWATRGYGAVGAGYAWCVANLAYFIFWIPVVHRCFIKGLQHLWLWHDVMGIAIATGACAAIARASLKWPSGRVPAAGVVVLLAAALLIAAAAASPFTRETIVARLSARPRVGAL